ncbi:hypothetical protein AVEN_152117-1 [Araneus ventricosus]|uniref:Uncharacterized protein n=1 Tax=Araneus ventricosus TaxID=182803 RepID=A0A4Y2T3I0_ARAVE|nr:hypothetical protein AVEN_152117-1 [Araneus ventricosus]
MECNDQLIVLITIAWSRSLLSKHTENLPILVISSSLIGIGFDGRVGQLSPAKRSRIKDNAECHKRNHHITQENLQALLRSVKYCADSFDEHYSFEQFILS